MRRAEAELTRRDVRVLVVAFARVEALRGYLRRYDLPFEGLADPERRAYAAFGLGRGAVARVYHPRVWLAYLRLYRQGRRLGRIEGDTLQLGGDYLIGADGRLLLAHPGQDPTDRPAVESILTALDRAAGGTAGGG